MKPCEVCNGKGFTLPDGRPVNLNEIWYCTRPDQRPEPRPEPRQQQKEEMPVWML